VRLDVRHRLKPPSSPANILARHAWKLGLGVVVAVLLTARGAGPVYTHPHGLPTSVVATSVPCGDIKLDAGSTDTATWTAVSSPYGTASPYILPHNDPNLPTTDLNNPNCLTLARAADEIHVPAGVKLVIDGSLGPVQIFSHGTGIFVNGGQLKTVSTDATNTVIFDAEPDVPSWDGINVTAADAAHRGNASLSFVSIQHALTAITITSGATSSPDNASYGLTVRNSGIGPSYFDGIDATNTPISVSGRVDPLTLRPDGQFGTLNNIGSQGIKVTYDAGQPNYPASIPDKALDVENMTFGSSVPFGETTCVPLQPCAAGSIGNDAIQGNFVVGQQPIKLDNNSFFRAGSYGLDLTNANNPTITNNIFTCNGSGSPKPVVSCVGTLLRYPAVYLANVTNLKFAAGGLNNNTGQQNGLDAVGLNGQVVSDVAWQTPTNDANAPSLLHPPHALGYVVANGDLQVVSSKLTVKDGDVVKVKGGAILITSGSLDASSAGLKTFTSLRDNTVGIQACPSVFVQSCPSPLPANEWIGINLVSSTGNIANANILFPTKAIDISSGQASLTGPDGGSYGLVVSNSRLGPTFSDSVAINATPVYISTSKFCRIDTIPSDTAYLQCTGAGPGDHGINASYTGTPRPAAWGGLKLLGNDFQGSTNEAILGTALSGRLVDIENNTVEGAGTYGMHLVSADNLTLKGNGVTASGTGTPANTTTYAAIYLDGISKADFSGPVSGNTGTGNGLDAIAFHGSTADLKPLNWKTVGASGALGYLVDGDLAVNGDLTLATNDYAPVLGGAITMNGGTFSATGAVLSSLKEQQPHLPSCGSVFVPKISGVCPATTPGDWTGLILDPGKKNTLTDSEIRYAVTGISLGKPTVPPVAPNLAMTRSNVRNTAADGLATKSPVLIADGAFTGNAGHGIKVDLTGVTPSAAQPLAITGHTSISGSGQEGILAIALGDHSATIAGASVDRAGTFGINLRDAKNLTLTNNTVTNSAATYPAIYLNGFTGPFGTNLSPYIFGNTGAGNGIDAIAFHGTVTDDLVWQTARKTADPTQLLGYVLDNTLNMQPGKTLTVGAGDIVKVGNGGMLNLQGATLRADGTASSAQKIFTSLTDNSAGVVACPSVLLSGCGPAAPGDWAGINLSTSGANGTVVNASVRYAASGISIANGATSTYGSFSFGLVVSQSTVVSTKTDGIFASNTPISITDSSISGGVHGANVNLTNNPGSAAAVRLSGNRFVSTSAEAILGQGLFGQPVWITDNQVKRAGSYGIRLLNSNNLVLRNNNIVGSGGGPTASAGRYPAIYLPNVSADFARNVRGNVGSGNGLDSIAFDGTVTSSLTWTTPGANVTTKPLGYLLDGGLTLDGTTLTVNAGDVVKSLGGPITINGGSLIAAGTSTAFATFTSLKDNASGAVANAVSCPSVFVSVTDCGQPQAGNWGGIAITDKAGQRGDNTIDYGLIEYAITGISIDSGPVTSALPKLKVTNSKILHTSLDGISASDTPIDIEGSTIGDQATATPGTPPDIRAHGIIASFFSPASCPSPSTCNRLTLIGNQIYSTGKDGIVANGLGGQPTIANSNTVTSAGTYGIRLVGADQLALRDNTVTASGGPSTNFRYPAIYLSGVRADFELASVAGAVSVAGNHGSGNGLDVMAIHGEATSPLTWLTTNNPLPAALPLPPILSDHLGYLLDGGLTVDGNFITYPHDVVKVLTGVIKVNGALISTGTTFTSLKDGSVAVKACDDPDPTHGVGFDTVFVQRVSGVCPSAASGDWGGVSIGATASTIDGAAIRYATTGVAISGASLQVTNSAFAAILNDAIDITNLTQSNVVQGSTFSAITGTSIKLLGGAGTPPDGLSGDIFNGNGTPAVQTSGGIAYLTCSSVKSGGVSGDSHLSISDSDLLTYQRSGQTVADVTNTSSAPQPTLVAKNNLWNVTANTPSTGPVTGQTIGNVDSSPFLTSQTPVLVAPPAGQTDVTNNIGLTDANADSSLPLAPGVANLTATHAYGVSDLTFTVAFNRRMLNDPSQPLTVWFNSTNIANLLDASSHQVQGNWVDPTNPHTWSGTYQLRSKVGAAPATATNGLNYIFVSQGKSCVPDGPNQMATATGSFKAALSPSAVAVSVTPISNPNYGSNVTLNANVTSSGNPILDSSSPGGTQTAQIQFGITSSTIQPSSRLDPTRATGSASANVQLVTPAINAGSYTVTAQFPGDDQYTPGFGSFNPLVVNPAPTRMVLVSTPTPGSTAASLDTVTLQATVSTDQTTILGGAGPNPGMADGAVAFSVAGSNPCAATASSASTAGLVVTCSTNLSTITGHSVTATFNPTVTAPVNYATSNATLTGTQTTVTSTANGDGVSETLKATVTPNPSADGNVSFYDASTTPITVLCPGVTISGGVALCSSPGTTYAALANHNVEAVYATTGSTFAPSIGSLTQTTTTLSTSATAATGVTLTATVTPGAGTANPAGKATFTDGTGASITCSNATTPPNQVTVTAAAGNTSVATCLTDFSSTTGIGSKLALKASYTAADASVFGASYTNPTVTGTSTALANPGPVPSGQALTLTATVTRLGSGSDPTTGSVLFFDNGTKLTTCVGSNGDGSVTLTGSGPNANQASCTLNSGLSPAGTHPLTAIYNPAAGSGAAFGSSLSPGQNLVVSQSTRTTLTTAATAASGVTLKATVTPDAGTVNPTGTVTFTDGTGAAITCSNATTPPNQVIVTAATGNTSVASCLTDFSSTTGIGGKLALKASYTPADATVFGASITTPAVTGTSTALANPGPVASGKPLTLTATVTHLGSGIDPTTGSVLFFDNGTKLTTCTGSNGDGSVNLTGGTGANTNKALCTLSSGLTPAGNHPLTAIYNPATPAAGSSAAFGSSLSAGLSLVVSQSTATTLTTAATAASGVTLTATVTPDAGAVNPTGTATFTDGTGAAITCSNASTPPNQVTVTAATGNTSVASCLTDFSSTTGIGGKLALMASYSPTDATVFGASSTSPDVTGSKNTLALNNAAPVSITATVTDEGSSANPTTGTVLFFDNGSLITSCAGSDPVDHSVGVNSLGVAVCNLASSVSSADVLRAIYNPPAPSAGSSAAFDTSLTDPGLTVP